MTYACPRCRGSRTSATFDRFRMDARQQDLLVGIENIVEMQNVEEEDFAISKSSGADAEFDMIIGNIEDIIMEEDFQHLQQSFMEKYYHEFDDTEENKLSYTTIFNEYIEILEKHLEQQLIERVPGFNMDAFTVSLKRHKDEVSGDILDMLLTFTDFIAFKEMFVDYRAEKEGRGLDLSTGLVVKSLNSASSASLTPSLASQSS